MTPPIDVTKLVSTTDFAGDDPEEEALIREMIGRAHAYLTAFEWCEEVESYVGDVVVGGVVLVMLARIVPSDERADEWLWVIVGDLPPAYLVTDEAPDPASALDAYIGEMERRVGAVRTGKPVENLIPVETRGGEKSLTPRPSKRTISISGFAFWISCFSATHRRGLWSAQVFRNVPRTLRFLAGIRD